MGARLTPFRGMRGKRGKICRRSSGDRPTFSGSWGWQKRLKSLNGVVFPNVCCSTRANTLLQREATSVPPASSSRSCPIPHTPCGSNGLREIRQRTVTARRVSFKFCYMSVARLHSSCVSVEIGPVCNCIVFYVDSTHWTQTVSHRMSPLTTMSSLTTFASKESRLGLFRTSTR
jgi:hypothetical protein